MAVVNKDGQTFTAESLIDNIFIKDNLVYSSGLIYSDISDHYPIFISIPQNTTKANTDILEVKYRLMDEFRIRKFKSTLQNSIVIRELCNEQSAQIAFTIFLNTFNFIYDKYFPLITKKKLQKSPLLNLG